jgi:hypothetical protein
LKKEVGLMMSSVTGYYDGNQIIMNENMKLAIGQEVIITILDAKKTSAEKIDLSKYVGRGEKMFHEDAGEYIKELRSS